MWTTFWDMHSGGEQKEKFSLCFIEAPEKEAISVFYSRFKHNPERVTCTCCGGDYSISENISLAQATGFHRGCGHLETPRNKKTGLYIEPKNPEFKKHYYLEEGEKPPKGFRVDTQFPSYNKYQTVKEFIKSKDIHVIYAKDIKAKERKVKVPEEGYVWKE